MISRKWHCALVYHSGGVAQMVERTLSMREGSIPCSSRLFSTKWPWNFAIGILQGSKPNQWDPLGRRNHKNKEGQPIGYYFLNRENNTNTIPKPLMACNPGSKPGKQQNRHQPELFTLFRLIPFGCCLFRLFVFPHSLNSKTTSLLTVRPSFQFAQLIKGASVAE